MAHVNVSKLTNIGSDNGLSPGRRQAIIQTNAGILLIEPLGTNFSEIVIEIHTISFKKMHLKMSSGRRWPYCFGLNVLNRPQLHRDGIWKLSTVHRDYSLQIKASDCAKLATKNKEQTQL